MLSTEAAGPSTLAPVTPRKERRRSWFGLVTPKRKHVQPTIFAPTQELPPSSSAESSTDHLEELDATPQGASSAAAASVPKRLQQAQRQRPWTDSEDTDMDSDLEGTLRRRASARTTHSDDGRPRQKDTATLAILSRGNTAKPRPFPPRNFSRSGSEADDSAMLSAQHTDFPSVLTPSKVPRRVSSVNGSIKANFSGFPVMDLSYSPTDTTLLDGKPLPELRKPLPALPPQPQFGVYAPREGSFPAPPVVVTPSSPLDKDPFEGLFGLDVPSSPERPRPSSAPASRTPSKRISRPRLGGRSESPTPANERERSTVFGPTLGLGLPDVLRRSSAPEAQSVPPTKQQAVSSPLPMRSTTPNLTVSFAAEHDKQQHLGNGSGSGSSFTNAKESKARPRSISALFTRSPDASQEPTDDERSGAKMGWLNKAKTIRRRRSEAKLAKKRSGFFTDNDIGTSTDDQRDAAAESAERSNASTPMPLSTSAPSQPMAIPGRRPSAASSRSSLNGQVEEQQVQQVSRPVSRQVESPAPDMEMMMAEREQSKEAEPSTSWKERARSDCIVPKPTLASSPQLGSLPELGPAPAALPTIRPVVGRGRSQSDAAKRGRSEDGSMASSPLSMTPDATSPLGQPVRPSLGGRANSGNSVVMDKVRNVFSKSNRPRSNSALRFAGDELDPSWPHGESSDSNFSWAPSPALPPVRIRPEDVPQVSSMGLQPGEDDRRVVLCETPDRSPRSSFAGSLSSRNTHWTQRSLTLDPTSGQQGCPPRARASTIASASGALSWQGSLPSAVQFSGPYGNGSTSHLPVTPTFPTAATPPRQRSGSIRRLSTGLFRSNPSSPRPPAGGNLFPLPARGGSATQSDEPQSRGPSPVPGIAPPARPVTPAPEASTLKKEDIAVQEGDTPDSWLDRLSVISRRELAGVLANSPDKFYTDALGLYMSRFDFTHIALDVALRRLLMHMSLPKETQQIDRVIEAFASRYDACEPGLFGSKDNGYVLAFSMMMLHTDAFNRHNKNKMTKPDYVRNTRLDGVHETVLEVIFDNITFTPFVFIEDDHEAALAAAGTPLSAVNGQARSSKIDVYDLIVGGQLGTLRVDIERVIPATSPYSCMGTQPFLDIDRLQWAFANAHPLQFVKNGAARRKSVSRPMSMGDSSALAPKEEVTTLKVTKVGLISRKDDSPASGKRTGGRKWKSWSVILTGSQLLFFKDTIWALTLVEQIRNASKSSDQSATPPRMTTFQPDEVLSVKDCVAIFDREYTATENTFRFVMPNSREFLMQATDESQMNEWLSLINYASTFKSAGIRMRAAGLDSGEAVKAGTTAAVQHKQDLETGQPSGITPPLQSRAVLFADAPLVDEPGAVEPAQSRPMLRRVGSMRSAPAPVVDVAGANAVIVDDGEQLEAVIGSVKAELAAGRGTALRTFSPTPEDAPGKSLRTEHINDRVQGLKSTAAETEKRLTANLRIARNLAILTPFQKASRERVEAALPDLAQRIRSDRIELAKLHLWITLLLKDQDRDQRDWARVRHVALQAAAQTLRTDLADRRRATSGTRPIPIPKLSLPGGSGEVTEVNANANAKEVISPETPEFVSPLTPSHFPRKVSEDADVDADADAPAQTDSARTSDSRTSDSEYELAREYLSSSVTSLREDLERQLVYSFSEQEVSPGGGLGSGLSSSGVSPMGMSPAPSPGVEEELVPAPRGSGSRSGSGSGDGSGDGNGVGQGEEKAEDWQRTRAATKVSLAQLPRSSIGELSRKILRVDT